MGIAKFVEKKKRVNIILKKRKWKFWKLQTELEQAQWKTFKKLGQFLAPHSLKLKPMIFIMKYTSSNLIPRKMQTDYGVGWMKHIDLDSPFNAYWITHIMKLEWLE